jgi:aminoglycoside/choline kinase family phosphotransferase
MATTQATAPENGTRDDAREAAKTSFLAAAGFSAARRAPLAGDASARRYERVIGGPAPAVLMDAPPDAGEDVRPFAALTGWLRAQGFGAPEIYAAAPEDGFLLLEDLGDGLFARLCAADPSCEATLYAAAVDLLLALRELPPPERAERAGVDHVVPPYDMAALLREARLAVDWWAPAAGAPLSPDASSEFDAQVETACGALAYAREVLVLRDYHAENLIWAAGATGLGRVRLLDYQDALAGHPAYDLISLLEDARRDTSEALRAAMTARYVAGARVDPAQFAAEGAALAAQRNLKIVGIFARLALRDRKPGYLSLIPRVWGHLRRDLAHPALAPLSDFVTRHIPAPTRERLAAVAARVA